MLLFHLLIKKVRGYEPDIVEKIYSLTPRYPLFEHIKQFFPQFNKVYGDFLRGEVILYYHDVGHSFGDKYKDFDDFSHYFLYYWWGDLFLMSREGYKNKIIRDEKIKNRIIFKTLFSDEGYFYFNLGTFKEKIKEISKEKKTLYTQEFGDYIGYREGNYYLNSFKCDDFDLVKSICFPAMNNEDLFINENVINESSDEDELFDELDENFFD
jgi:hypothetical protein